VYVVELTRRNRHDGSHNGLHEGGKTLPLKDGRHDRWWVVDEASGTMRR
jgi:hypothetical protein